jgi:hypothetical protein
MEVHFLKKVSRQDYYIEDPASTAKSWVPFSDAVLVQSPHTSMGTHQFYYFPYGIESMVYKAFDRFDSAMSTAITAES